MDERRPRFLIIKPSSLGDVVHALPVLAALRAAHPQAHVAWLVGNAFAPLLDGHPLLDEIIRFDRRRYGRMWFDPTANVAFWRFVADVRRRRFDCVIDLQGLIRSGLISWFSGAKRRIGFAEAREGARWFYTQRVSAERDMHAVERNLALIRAMNIPAGAAEFPLAVTDAERAAAANLLASAAAGRPLERFIAVLPGARWKSKQWPPASFAAAIDALQADGAACVLLGAPDERPLADEIIRACRGAPLDLVGRTNLRELTAVLSLAERVICCDSGPMHIAAALGRPIVAIFGPTSPQRTGPVGPHSRVARELLPCSPCYRKTCPLGHHACMRDMPAERILEMVRESILSTPPR